MVSGLIFRVSGFVSGFGFRVSFWDSGFRFRVSGFGFRIYVFGFRVSGFRGFGSVSFFQVSVSSSVFGFQFRLPRRERPAFYFPASGFEFRFGFRTRVSFRVSLRLSGSEFRFSGSRFGASFWVPYPVSPRSCSVFRIPRPESQISSFGYLAPLPSSSTRICVTRSVHKVVLQRSIPAHIRQLFLHVSNNEDKMTNSCGN